MTTASSLDVLHEDNHLLVVNKPAELATMGTDSAPTLHRIAAEYLKRKYNKPGNAFVGIVSRLDAMTTGVIVLARTSKAASRLVPQFAGKLSSDDTMSADSSGKSKQRGKKKRVTPAEKIYLAIVVKPRIPAAPSFRLDLPSGTLHDFLRKDDQAKRMRVCESGDSASEAILEYLMLAQTDEHYLFAVKLGTGRKHQIRVQFADRGMPVLGDRKYGSRQAFGRGIALHSWKLQITHPTLAQRYWFTAPIPKTFRQSLSCSFDERELQKRVAHGFRLSNTT